MGKLEIIEKRKKITVNTTTTNTITVRKFYDFVTITYYR